MMEKTLWSREYAPLWKALSGQLATNFSNAESVAADSETPVGAARYTAAKLEVRPMMMLWVGLELK